MVKILDKKYIGLAQAAVKNPKIKVDFSIITNSDQRAQVYAKVGELLVENEEYQRAIEFYRMARELEGVTEETMITVVNGLTGIASICSKTQDQMSLAIQANEVAGLRSHNKNLGNAILSYGQQNELSDSDLENACIALKNTDDTDAKLKVANLWAERGRYARAAKMYLAAGQEDLAVFIKQFIPSEAKADEDDGDQEQETA